MADSVLDTRQAAHLRTSETKADTWAKIMVYAAQRGPRGFTADELAADWHCSPNHTAPRVTELVKDGRLVRSGRTRRTRSG